MTERSFETRLERGLQAVADGAIRPIDAHAIAVGSVRNTGRASWANAFDRIEIAVRRPALAAAATVVLLALVAVAVLAIGAMSQSKPLAFIRGGDLFVASADGSDAVMIAERGAQAHGDGYVVAHWAPDMRHLAVVREDGDVQMQAHVEILEPNGTRVGVVDLPPGGIPMIAWSPDSARIVMQPFPTTDAKSDGGERTAPVELSIVDLDGHVERTLPTPPGLQTVFILAPIVVIGPQTLSWSPDGRWIAVHVSTGVSVDLWMVAADGSGSRRVASPGAGGITRFAWHPSGAVVTVASSCDGLAECGLWDIDVDRGEATPVAGAMPLWQPDENLETLAWSPTSDRLALTSDRLEVAGAWSDLQRARTSLFVVDAGRVARVVTGVISDPGGALDQPTDERIVGVPMAWSAGGERILYMSFRDDDVSGGATGANPPARILPSLRSIDAAGSTPSKVIARDVTWFDLGRD